MGYIMSFLGLIMAVLFFIYFINALDEGKRKIKELTDPVAISPGRRVAEEVTPQSGSGTYVRKNLSVKNLSEAEKDLVPRRICPVCMTELSRDQPLYAGNMEHLGKRTILIYGCQFCYREKDNTVE